MTSRMVAPILIYISIPIAFPNMQTLLCLIFFKDLWYDDILQSFASSVLCLRLCIWYIARNNNMHKPFEGLQTKRKSFFFIGAIINISIFLIKQSPKSRRS